MQTGFLWTESIHWHFLCLFLVLMWMFCLIWKRCIIQVFFPLCYFAATQVGFESRSRLCSLRWWFGVVVGAPRGGRSLFVHDATVKANSQAWVYTVCAPPPAPLPPGLCFHRCCLSLLFVWRHQKLPTHDARFPLACLELLSMRSSGKCTVYRKSMSICSLINNQSTCELIQFPEMNQIPKNCMNCSVDFY